MTLDSGDIYPDRHVLYRSVQELPPTAVNAKGIYIYLDDGSKILDAVGGASVSCLGHSHPDVISAMTKSLNENLIYAYSLKYTSNEAEELADLLLKDRPGGLTKAHFVSSGSEAMEAALKVARQYFVEIGQTQRTIFIGREQSYHGNTIGALSIGGHWSRREPFEPILSKAMTHVAPCYPYRHQQKDESSAEYVDRLINELDSKFQELGPENVIAFVMEPIVGNATGCVAALPGYIAGVRKLCDKYGALLIFDEVMCGMGRTGDLHAWQHEGIPPDIQTMGKGLGGGYQPIAAVLINERVVEGLSKAASFNSGHTYQAHPLTCVAATAVQKIIIRDNLLENVKNMGALLERELRAAFADNPIVGDIRGRGLFWGLELVADRDTKAPISTKAGTADLVSIEGMKHGVALLSSGGTMDGVNGNHVIISPPYNVTEDEVKLIVSLTKKSIDAVADTLIQKGYVKG